LLGGESSFAAAGFVTVHLNTLHVHDVQLGRD